MLLKDIMTTRLVTVEFDDSLQTVREIFDALGFHHVLVVDDKKLFGVVSDRDLLKALSPFLGTVVETDRDVGTLHRKVHQIMSRKPITLGPEANAADAVQLFLKHQISCIPIVDDKFAPIGIVSWRDILRFLAP
jgi:acetoin utilization protein AcuB